MANDNGHHVIPSSVFDRSPLLSELNQNGLMLRDGQLNIISLPNDTEGALASGFAMHNGGDYVHMQYTQMVAGIVREIEGNSLNPISDLLTLQTILRDGLSPQIIAPDSPLGQYLTNNGIPIPNRPAPVFQVNQNDPNPVNLVSPDLNWLGMQQLFPQYFTPFSPLDPGLQAITNGGVPGYAPPIFGTQPEGYTPLDLGIPSGEGLTPTVIVPPPEVYAAPNLGISNTEGYSLPTIDIPAWFATPMAAPSAAPIADPALSPAPAPVADPTLYQLPAGLGGAQLGQTAPAATGDPVAAQPNGPLPGEGNPEALPLIDVGAAPMPQNNSLEYAALAGGLVLGALAVAALPGLGIVAAGVAAVDGLAELGLATAGLLASAAVAEAAPSASEDATAAADVPPPSPPPSPTDMSPIVLDLTGKGIKITPLSSSNTFFDMNGNGELNLTAWAGAGNAVLFYDPNNTNQITQADQVVFTDWDPSATNDMQALEDAFDTNHDGSLDAGDADFSDFKLMITNANGTTTVETLAQAGITSINLTPNNVTQTFSDGSSIDGETTYTTTSGTTGTAAAVTFAVDPNGYRVQSTTTTNATTGAVTVDNKTFNPDGSLAGEIISTTSANGLSETIQYDDTGDGQIDRTRTGNTVRRFAQWRRRPLAAFGGRRNGTTRRGGRLRRPPPARTVPRRAGTGGTLARRGGDARG